MRIAGIGDDTQTQPVALNLRENYWAVLRAQLYTVL